jgi:hypothetical protein
MKYQQLFEAGNQHASLIVSLPQLLDAFKKPVKIDDAFRFSSLVV